MDAVMQLLHTFQNRLELTAFEFFSESALAKVLARSASQTDGNPGRVLRLLEFDNTSAAIAMPACLT